jgi:hypothetical protein
MSSENNIKVNVNGEGCEVVEFIELRKQPT